jgi:hypothetical protein
MNRFERFWSGELAKAKSGEDRMICLAQMREEQKELDAEYGTQVTAHLFNTARILGVPLPKHNNEDYDSDNHYTSRALLTVEGKHKLIKAIREERRARREPVITWASLFIGAVGAAIGLLSMIKDVLG